jgi:hypothetical protein
MKPTACLFAGLAFAAVPSPAAMVATDDFGYPDGSIADRSGGTGWNNEFTDEPGAPPQAPSDWDVVFGAPAVSSGALVTNGSGAKREFGGAGEGVIEPSNEREGAFRGTGKWFLSVNYSVDVLFGAGSTQWGGISSYDFGAERIFWGMPGQDTGTRYFGVEESGVGTTLSSIPIAANTLYTLMVMLDFDNNVLGLWVNPDSNDTESSYDVSRSYGATNWSTAVRLASAGGANITWDNLAIATTFSEAIPEPSAALLGGLGALGLLRRRRA